jgi:RNA polymerase sigma-70 factor (ECF subfamily)
VSKAQDFYPECPEAFLVSLARTADRGAFEELVRRRQSSIRNLMRRVCSDATLADDLTQQVFLKVWLNIRKLREVKAFGAWLKRLAVSVWLQHVRKKDALRGADEFAGVELVQNDSTGMGMDLDDALATLPYAVRLCIVLSYNEGMSHREIAELTALPLGTVKSHINRGVQRLQRVLSAYSDEPEAENSR